MTKNEWKSLAERLEAAAVELQATWTRESDEALRKGLAPSDKLSNLFARREAFIRAALAARAMEREA